MDINAFLEKKNPFNKKKIVLRRFPTIKFDRDEWVVHTFDTNTQYAIASYLNNKGLVWEMKEIFYKGKTLTCFPIKSAEMIHWLRRNTADFPGTIFHRIKDSKLNWSMLLQTTNVK
jgi:hypothetical protein